ncbi:hypothetical protein BGW36DRAFT_256289, partial [Talaromyces proteolyticus]
MLSRSALRGLVNFERSATRQFLVSSPYTPRACLRQASTSGPQKFHATPPEIPPAAPSQKLSPSPSSSSSSSSSATPIPPSNTPSTQQEQPLSEPETLSNGVPRSKLPLPPIFTSPLQISKSLAEKLPYLYSQRPHYISAHLHDRPYLLTEGDHLRLPFLMPKVKSGDILRFNRASIIGSREYTLKGTPYVDERMFECRVRVLGVESEPLRIKEKTKRRQRHVQRVKSKHRYTIMRVMEVKVKSLEELLEEGAEIVE